MAAASIDFGNLKNDSGLEKLNDYLLSRSYITGYTPTQDDAMTFAKLLGPPGPTKLPHANRWYRHIGYFSMVEQSVWPKGKMAMEAAKKEKAEKEEFDLFGDEGATKEASKALAEKMKTDSAAAKPKKVVINKSSLVIEIKPNDVSTDLEKVWELVKNINIEGVTWGLGHKKVPIAYGLYKLQVSCVILDDLVNTVDITDQIEALGMDAEEADDRRRKREMEEDDEEEEAEGLVQSAEIVSFNKL